MAHRRSKPTPARSSSTQTTVNLDFRGNIDWGIGSNPLSLATGAEWRKDGYAIEAGDPVSYTYGRTDNRGIPILGQDGVGIAQPGMQGFPGFSPREAVDESRHNWAVYLDGESNLTKRLPARRGDALRGLLGLRHAPSPASCRRAWT